MFASEIFTAKSQIPEEPPEVIHINEMHEALKRIGYIGLKPATSLSKYENNLEVFKQAYCINVAFFY